MEDQKVEDKAANNHLVQKKNDAERKLNETEQKILDLSITKLQFPHQVACTFYENLFAKMCRTFCIFSKLKQRIKLTSWRPSAWVKDGSR